ncbi:MAG: M18 family aminopeptidase [Myxococcales bacterium]|nr:M18 family aminopeptidase [Myxococcales bacterium]
MDATTTDADALLTYIDASPSPYHAVTAAAARLTEAGFDELALEQRWQLQPGGRHFVIKGGSIAAFIVGSSAPVDSGFLAIGAHTDSPNLRLKPQPDLRRHGYHQLAVEIYGGVLLSTWLDRDLSLAGRVVIDDGSDGGRSELVDFRRPLLRIPNLAIHLERTVNTDGLKLNAQRHMVPIWALERSAKAAKDEPAPALRQALAGQLSDAGREINPEAILGWDLCLYDTQPAAIAGLRQELIHAARLDNLASCHTALTALTTAAAEHPATRVILLYDHEEVGSRSAHGAASPFALDLLGRLAGPDHDALTRAVARSFLISADMAHAVHPNYADKHEPGHRPVLGRGPVIKTNVSQAYASDAESSARFVRLCQRAGVEPQHFVSRSDLACGSTIGPITAGRVGLPTVDVGNPLLSMHSIREMAAVEDVGAMQKVLGVFFAGR